MLNQYLFLLFDRHPRRIKVIFNTVASHKTQATLFWSHNYGILNWLGADHSLKKATFASWIKQQVQTGFLAIDGKLGWLTSAGAAKKAEILHHYYLPQFDQWTWLVNPQMYADRFLLGVQALSHFLHRDFHYVPLNLSPGELSRVNTWVRQAGLAKQAAREIYKITQDLDQADPALTVLFVNQLFGYQLTGWSRQQAAIYFGISEEEIYMMDRDIWLFVAHYFHDNSASWGSLMNDLLAQWPISDSAMHTLQLCQDHSIEESARLRHLKLSTIREHLLEAAIIIPDYLDWDRLLPPSQRAELAKTYTGNPVAWQFKASDPEKQSQEFFIFRLYQIYRSQLDHE